MDRKDNSNSSKFFGDTIIIALITGLGYIATGFAENSYLKYFGISANASLVTPPITEIISVTLVICILVVFCLLISKPIYKLISPKTEVKENILYHLWSIFISYFIPFMIIKIWIFRKISFSLILEFLIIILFFTIIIWLMNIFIKKQNKKQKNEEKISDGLFLSNHLDNFIGDNRSKSGIFIVLFLGIMLVLNLAPSVGTGIAKRVTSFNVINNNPPLFVVAQYGNILIAAPFNQDSRQFINQTHLININTLEEHGLYLTKEKTGSIKSSIQDKSVWNKLAESMDKIFEWDLP